MAEANDRARAVLRRRDALTDEDGVLQAVLPEEDEALQRLVARTALLSGGPGAGGSMRLSRHGSTARLALHVSPVQVDGPEPGEGRIGAQVLVVDPMERTEVEPFQLEELLGLTPPPPPVVNDEDVVTDSNCGGDGQPACNCGDHLCNVNDCHWHWEQSDAVGDGASVKCGTRDQIIGYGDYFSMTISASDGSSQTCTLATSCKSVLEDDEWQYIENGLSAEVSDMEDLNNCAGTLQTEECDSDSDNSRR